MWCASRCVANPDLFTDDDGKAYCMSAANNNQGMMLYQLTDEYLDVKQLTIKLFAGKQCEAPAMFKVGGTYFFIISAATGWDPNQAQYATATNFSGPWSSLTNIGDSTTQLPRSSCSLNPNSEPSPFRLCVLRVLCG